MRRKETANLDSVKVKINQLKRELSKLEESNEPIPELINSTNLLRSNEILTKTNAKKTQLLSAYESYFQELEHTLAKIKTRVSSLKASSKRKTRKKPSKKKKKSKNKTRKNIHSRKKPRKRKPSKRKR